MRRSFVQRFFVVLVAAFAGGDLRTHASDDFEQLSKHEITLEAKGGFFDYQPYDLGPAQLSALRANATIQKIERISQWIPAFGFWIANTETEMVGFQVRCDGRSKPTAALVRYAKNQEVEKQVFESVLSIGEAFEIEMAWTQEGGVTATLGVHGRKERHELNLGLKPKELRVMVSGGRLEVSPLVLGKLTR